MTVKELDNRTYESYERAMRTGNINDIANTIRGYQIFCNLYQMDMFSRRTFNDNFTHLYNMASLVYNKYLVDNSELSEKIKRMTQTSFKEFVKIKY